MSNKSFLTYVLVLFTTLCTIGGQLLLKRGIVALKPLLADGPIVFLIGAASTPLVYAALALQVAGYAAWMFVLTRESLSIAFALSGSSFYLLMAFASWWFFGERLTPIQWVGLGLISLGVVLVTNIRG